MGMREILFRGKRKDFPGGWVYGWYQPPVKWGNHNFSTAISHFCDEGWLDDTEVIPETVGQFTGISDSNGEKIFEGDVVEIAIEDEPLVVEWCEDSARFVLSASTFCCDFDNYWGHEMEVIGNIHDNPELLEGRDGNE